MWSGLVACIGRGVNDELYLLEFLLTLFLYLYKLSLHLQLELFFYLIRVALQPHYFLLDFILPAKVVHRVLFPLILDHWKYFFL